MVQIKNLTNYVLHIPGGRLRQGEKTTISDAAAKGQLIQSHFRRGYIAMYDADGKEIVYTPPVEEKKALVEEKKHRGRKPKAKETEKAD